MAPVLRALAVVLAVLLLEAPPLQAQLSFPRQGRATLQQQCLDLEHPAVVLLVSQRPGDDDLPLLAFLRTRIGARAMVVHLTNGEATPGDTLADVPRLLAGERKEEAYRAAAALDADTWFLNVPDPGAAENGGTLAPAWSPHSIAMRLTDLIRNVRPDCIVVGKDRRRPESATARDSVAREAVRLAADWAWTAHDTLHGSRLPVWRVARIAVEEPAPRLPREFLAIHPPWKISSLAMAELAASRYATLRLTIGGRALLGRKYVLLAAGKTVAPGEMLANLPAVSPLLRGAAGAMRKAVTRRPNGVRTASLRAVSAAIDSCDHLLRHHSRDLSLLDRRVAVTWKNDLEDLRCTLLDVRVDVTPSDSLVAESQVWFLRVRDITPAAPKGSLEIVFPLAMGGEWYVNDTLGYRFPLALPKNIPVLTPEKLTLNAPASLYGVTASAMRLHFPFFILHNDTVRERNFIYRGEALFRVGPKRSFEVRTPVVLALPGAGVVVSMMNFSRDSFSGTIALHDTGSLADSVTVRLDRKDQLLVDTLSLPWRTAPPPGNYPWTVELSGRGGRYPVTARSLAVASDTSAPVGLMTAVSGSPVTGALKALKKSGLLPAGTLPPQNGVVVVDRDALCGEKGGEVAQRLRGWITEGGRAIVMPQDGDGALRLRELCHATFRQARPLTPETAVTVNDSALNSSPNRLGPDTWSGWVEARAWYVITTAPGAPEPGVAATSGGLPVVTSVRLGKGRVTLVALDLWSQLMNLHEGAYRLFANLLALP